MKKQADTHVSEKQSTFALLRRWAVVWLLAGLVLLSISAYFYISSAVFKKSAYSTQGKVVHMAYANILMNDIVCIAWIVSHIRTSHQSSSDIHIPWRRLHYPIVQFADHQGNIHQLRSKITRVGASYPNTIPIEIIQFGITIRTLPQEPLVTVLFNPNNPQDFMIDDGQPWFVIVFMVSGIALLLFALICFISVWQVKNRIRKNNP